MPITKSAIKALRKDRKRAESNRPLRTRVKSTTDIFTATPTLEGLSKAFQAIDRAAKKHIMHKNKAARMKSKLSKLVAGK